MKRFLIAEQNELAVHQVDEDLFRFANGEIELLMNYDSAFELALKLTRLLHEADLKSESSSELSTEDEACECCKPQALH